MFWPNVALIFLAAGSNNQVLRLDEEFVRQTLALSPTSATTQGYHKHNGIVLDDLLDDESPAGIRRSRELYHEFLARVDRFSKHDLNDEDRADLDIIRLQCEYQLLDFDKIQGYRHNPTFYVEIIGNAIYTPFVLNYAPESTRLGQITSRIEKIPDFLKSAKQNLVSSPQVWNVIARQENQGDIDLIDKTVRAKIPLSLRPRFDVAAGKALSALRSFDTYLKTDLSRRTSDWRLGASLYADKWRTTLAIDSTPEKALKDAQAKLQVLREEMRNEALKLYPKFFPGKAAPQDLNSLVSQVLGKIAQRHATAAGYFPAAKRDLAEATAFVKTKQLLDLAGMSGLEVIPTPEFMRGIYGVGGFAPAPILQPKLGSFYWITPITKDMTAAQAESQLREYNDEGLQILTIHEAMPGHYVQFEYADKVLPQWRAALRETYFNNPYVEGWAVYATELMIDEGYMNTPEMRLTFGKQMLRVVANTILDIKLQTMNMSDEEAMKLMIDDTFQEREEAEKKLQRAKLSSCQLPTYFAGWLGWDQLRGADQKRLGSEFRLSEFHERALKEGSIPLSVLSKILLQ